MFLQFISLIYVFISLLKEWLPPSVIVFTYLKIISIYLQVGSRKINMHSNILDYICLIFFVHTPKRPNLWYFHLDIFKVQMTNYHSEPCRLLRWHTEPKYKSKVYSKFGTSASPGNWRLNKSYNTWAGMPSSLILVLYHFLYVFGYQNQV